MQAVIKYDLTNEQDKLSFERAIVAEDMAIALQRISTRLNKTMVERFHNELVDKSQEFTEGFDEAVAMAEEIIQETLERYGINLNHLVE
jgi:hypothetical protein